MNAAEATRDVTVGSGGVRLQLPESWIDSVVGAQQDGQVLLFTRWPVLTGYRDGHEHDHPRDEATYDGVLLVLLTLSDRATSLQVRYERTKRFFAPLARYPSTMGLEHWGKDLPPGGDYTTKLEVYFEPDDQQVGSFIACDLPGTAPSPGCAAQFYIGPFLAEVTYSRVFLPQWRAIEDGVRARVLSFLTNSSSTKIEKGP